jgi:hypothetical protein
MSHLCSTVVQCWGTRPTLRLSGYLWVAAMLGVLAALEPDWSISGAAFRGDPDHPHVVAGRAGRSTYALIVGSVCGAAVGTGASFFGSGLGMAVLAMIAALSSSV